MATAALYRKYPDTPYRIPREELTPVLEDICTHLDQKVGTPTLLKSQFKGQTPVLAELRAKALWVVGSYARGAATCTDLDLVLECETTKSYELFSSLSLMKYAKSLAVLGARKGVRVEEGTPADNTAGFRYEEAILVWEPGMDWSAAIASIATDPSAQRFPRALDAIPLGPVKLRDPLWDFNALLQAKAAKELSWKFTPLSEITPVSKTTDPDELKVIADMEALQKINPLSKREYRLLPIALGLARLIRKSLGFQPKLELHTWGYLRVGTHLIKLGLEKDPIQQLGRLTASSVSSVFELTAQGPNGAWTVERGSQHPMVKRFKDLHLWVEPSCDASVPVHPCTAEDLADPLTCRGVYVRSRLPAHKPHLKGLKKLVGKEILEFAGLADVVIDESTGVAIATGWSGSEFSMCTNGVDSPYRGYGFDQLESYLREQASPEPATA